MHNPFPGMEPYLESAGEWLDFQAMFLASWRESLIRLLPEPYEVWIDEHVQLVGPPGSGARLVRPDLAVSRRGREPAESGQASGVATLEPVAVPLPALETEDLAVRYLKILKRPERALVTTLELLSPANKREPGRTDYCAKRNALRRQGVHLVELDLLVKGQRLPMDGPLPRGDYYALVSRADGRAISDVFAWTIRQPLPRLPIPLREPDPDVWSDLGAVFATAYARGAYARLLPYSEPLELPLGDEDRAWVSEQARRRGA